MDGRSFWHEDHAETNSSHPPNRQKTFHHDLGNVAHKSRNGSTTLRHDHYTIAWICALYIEMAAAQAMLDEVHEALPRHANDNNSYTLGSIKQHNVVIACLPDAQYGTNDAANVLTNLTRTFPSIRRGLMVGIGGGAPSKADIRLGDIVVGIRVMQYNLGKVVEDGKIQRTATPKIPGYSLRTAVTNLRSQHEFEPSRIPFILREKMERRAAYSRPSTPDRLFQASYKHEAATPRCDHCDQSKLVWRRARVSDDPMIHYGAIASGNQVMKDATTRDNVARELDIICFEMEAAGLMDVLPCLPIRGICDYSDSHKAKEWQRYAAATAAAYAREFLEVLAVDGEVAEAGYMPDPGQDASQDRRQRLLDSLTFEQIDARKTAIKPAHAKTCHWFLKHPDYQAWLDPQKLSRHHGFLWIRGKPGAGKSTIMKFIYMKMKKKDIRQQAITASFFFNARGEYLEKSISGMYRSLLLQLLEGFPDLQEVFDDPDLVPRSQTNCPSLNVLKSLFRSAISALGERSFTCFVDALDECDEQQVMDLVEYFEDLAEHCTETGVRLQICFSSRHYPYVDVRLGIRLALEDQDGHAGDLDNYIKSNLRIKDPSLVEELRPKMLEKAAGVFLWVALVVDILNKENRRGRLALKKRLAEAPSGLSELFKDLLRRDNENMEELLLCILWILYAKRPLRPDEYYHALWSGLSLENLADPEIPIVTVSDGRDYFLVKDGGLHELWPDLGFDWESPSHERLKQCCNSYMNHTLVRASVSKLHSQATEISKEYPFLEYASQHVFYHANAAADAVPQDEFLSCFSVPNWISFINLFEKFKIREYSPDASLFYLLAENGFSELIRTRLKEDPRVHVFGEIYGYPLFAALANGNKDAVAALLNSPSSICNGVDITEGLNGRKDLKEYENRTPLSWAAQNGRVGIVKLLLQTGTTVNDVDWGGRMSLSLASENGHEASENGYEAVVRLLIGKGADANASDKDGWTPLLRASERGHEAVVRLLIDKRADVNASDNDGWTPLLRALENGHEAVAMLLIIKGADVHASNEHGWTPLLRALRNGYEAVVRVLIDKGADINASDKYGISPLFLASRKGHEAVVRLLINKRADVNASDNNRWTPLLRASENGYEAVAMLLIDEGADVNASNEYGWTPHFLASRNHHEAVAKLLVEKGVEVSITPWGHW
ncbi:hypothetical protein BGZ61DRAFT_511306 [Ilyonectria robusta]|uniref:uncharacterized protein n=1 Tax=Ilyonectria robusta TaxID=1079257 RepID=UPI001E8EA1ED|nr:uncharacterized protein BGZ61DRAFT_511306 [Ilyonectria robusta]KAH8649522.1 hypothetical protein BGZ61DRAFT_511306 [Ilyonectria robusta]